MYGFTHSFSNKELENRTNSLVYISAVVGALHQISGDLYTVRDLLYDIHIVVTYCGTHHSIKFDQAFSANFEGD